MTEMYVIGQRSLLESENNFPASSASQNSSILKQINEKSLMKMLMVAGVTFSLVTNGDPGM